MNTSYRKNVTAWTTHQVPRNRWKQRLRSLLAAALVGAACVSGSAASGADARFGIAAYDQHGELYPAVIGAGKFTTTFPPEVGAVARAAVVDPWLGRLYVAGTAGNDSIAIARYDYNGKLDLNFGSGGRVLTPFDDSGKFSIRDMAIDQSSRIVVVGYHGKRGLLARYLPDGTLDVSFYRSGIREFGPLGGYDYVRGLAVAIVNGGRDGDLIVVSGDAQRQDCQFPGPAFDGGMLIARFLPNGQLDPAFGYGNGYQGFVIQNTLPKYCGIDSSGWTWHHYEEARDVAIDDEGRIVVAGVVALDAQETYGSPGVYDQRGMVVRRYLPDGQPDLTFGPPWGGVGLFSNLGPNSHGNSLLIDPEGRIVVAGQAKSPGANCFAIARITPQGMPDNSFSGDGQTLTCYGTFGTSEIKDIAIGFGGDVMAGGWVGTPTGDYQRFALARYRNDGNLDTYFGGDGRVVTDFTCKGEDAVEALAIEQFGPFGVERIFAAGWAEGNTLLCPSEQAKLQPLRAP